MAKRRNRFKHVTPLDYWIERSRLENFAQKDLPPILHQHGVDSDALDGCIRCIMIMLRQAISK